MRIGLLGGTFDPIHLGHLIVAEDVRMRLDLGRVVFVPAHQPWLKADRKITDPAHRLAMVRLAIASNPAFEVSTAELDRDGPSYTVDTVYDMKSRLGPAAEMFFIAGADAVADMPRWKDPHRIVALCQIVWVKRPGAADIDLSSLMSTVPGAFECFGTVDVTQVDISSTAIRERIRLGHSVRYLVPAEVEAYIHEHGLYST